MLVVKLKVVVQNVTLASITQNGHTSELPWMMEMDTNTQLYSGSISSLDEKNSLTVGKFVAALSLELQNL